jgi:hypothetical protein
MLLYLHKKLLKEIALKEFASKNLGLKLNRNLKSILGEPDLPGMVGVPLTYNFRTAIGKNDVDPLRGIKPSLDLFYYVRGRYVCSKTNNSIQIEDRFKIDKYYFPCIPHFARGNLAPSPWRSTEVNDHLAFAQDPESLLELYQLISCSASISFLFGAFGIGVWSSFHLPGQEKSLH